MVLQNMFRAGSPCHQAMIFGVRGMKSLFGLQHSHFSDIARIGNQGSIGAFQIFGGVSGTGLNRGFSGSCFRITDYPVRNAKRRIMRGEKPALIFPIGWQIGSWTAFGTRVNRGFWFTVSR